MLAILPIFLKQRRPICVKMNVVELNSSEDKKGPFCHIDMEKLKQGPLTICAKNITEAN